MADDTEPTPETVERVNAILEGEKFTIPKWYPVYQRELYKRLCIGISQYLDNAFTERPTRQAATRESKRLDESKNERLAVFAPTESTPKHLKADQNLKPDPDKTLRAWLDQIKKNENPPTPGVFATHHISLVYELAFLEYVADLDAESAWKEFDNSDAFNRWMCHRGGIKSGASRRKKRDDRKQILDALWPKVREYIQSVRVNETTAKTDKKEWELVATKFRLTEVEEAKSFIKRFAQERRVKKT